MARSLAALRSLYKWLAQEGVVRAESGSAGEQRRKLPKKLPRVPTIEEVNTVLDAGMPEMFGVSPSATRRCWNCCTAAASATPS